MIFVLLAGGVNKYNFRLIGKRRISGGHIYIIIICLIFAFIMAFRGLSVGVDTLPYSKIYSIIGNSSSYLEALSNAPFNAPIYILLNRILFHISSDPQILIIATSILVNVGLFVFIKRVSADPSMSAFSWVGLTFFYCSMNGNRQTLAMVLVLNSLYHLSLSKKSRQGWFLFIVSVGIHQTSIIVIFAVLGIFLVDRIRNSKIVFIISTTLSVVIALTFAGGLRALIRFFPKYLMYTSGESEFSVFYGTGSGRIIILYILLFCIICLWTFRTKNEKEDDNNFNRKMLPAVIFGTIFGIFNSQNELINRMLWYYLAIFVSFIPSTIQRYKRYEGFFIQYGIIIVLIIYSILSLIENQNGVVPYVFYWR